MYQGTTEGSNKKLNDVPAQLRFPTLANLQSQVNAVSKKIRTSQQIFYNNGALSGPVCGCFVFGIDYTTGDTFYKDVDGNWAPVPGGGGGGVFDATVEFSVNADPNDPGTTFNPNTPALTTVLYVSTIDFSQWTYDGAQYNTYVSPFWTTSGNPSVAAGNFIGSINNAALKFRTNNTQVGIFDTTGNFGIATAIPSEKLHVTGNVRFSGALMPNNLAGTSGYYLTSAGAGVAPTWTDSGTISWNLLGNIGTNPGTNFLGTTDNKGLMFKTNNVQSGYIDLINSNTSFGQSSLLNNTTGNSSVAIGIQALRDNLDQSANTAIGAFSCRDNTLGNHNTAVGYNTLRSSTSGYNTVLGTNIGITLTNSYNTIIGAEAFNNATDATQNSSLGAYSLVANTTGDANIALGYFSGRYNTTASNQVFINSIDRVNYAGDQTASPIYIQQNATVTSQLLTLNGLVGVNKVTPLYALDVLSSSSNNACRIVGSAGGGLILGSFSAAFGGIWSSGVVPSGTNYTVAADGASTIVNGTTGVDLSINSTSALHVRSNGNIGISAGTTPADLLTLGTAGSVGGVVSFAGLTSGKVTMKSASVAGTWTFTLPPTDGNAGEFLQTDGAGITTWAVPTPTTSLPLSSLTAATGTNTINSGTFLQEWQWNTLGGTGMKFSTTSTVSSANSVLVDVDRSGANGTASRFTYGLRVTNAHSGTTPLNRAIYATISNSTHTTGGSAVLAFADSSCINSYGVNASSSGTDGIGLFGGYSGVTGGTGIYGRTNGTIDTTATALINYAGRFFANSTRDTGANDLTNIAVHASATGGQNNYAIITDLGNVGIANSAPAELLSLGTTGSVKGVVSFAGNTSGKVIVQPAAAAGTWTLTLPTDDGNSGDVLQTDGGGITSWVAPSGGFTWTVVSGTSQAGAINSGYITNNGSLVTVTLPDTAAVGSIVRVTGLGAGGWRIAQNAGEQIIWNSGGVDGTNETTIGVTGRLDSTDAYDSIELICLVANTTWGVLSSKGNITLT